MIIFEVLMLALVFPYLLYRLYLMHLRIKNHPTALEMIAAYKSADEAAGLYKNGAYIGFDTGSSLVTGSYTIFIERKKTSETV